MEEHVHSIYIQKLGKGPHNYGYISIDGEHIADNGTFGAKMIKMEDGGRQSSTTLFTFFMKGKTGKAILNILKNMRQKEIDRLKSIVDVELSADSDFTDLAKVADFYQKNYHALVEKLNSTHLNLQAGLDYGEPKEITENE